MHAVADQMPTKTVPESALLIYENHHLLETWEELQTKPIWQNLERIQAIGRLNQHLTTLDTLLGGNDNLRQFTDQNPVLISLHVTSKTAFDFLYQVEVRDIESHSATWNALDQLGDRGYTTTQRNYLGHSLTEIKDGDKVFTYIFLQNYFVGSFTAFLVEDVIRTVNGSGSETFEASHRPLFSLVKLQNDEGNLFNQQGSQGSQ